MACQRITIYCWVCDDCGAFEHKLDESLPATWANTKPFEWRGESRVLSLCGACKAHEEVCVANWRVSQPRAL